MFKMSETTQGEKKGFSFGFSKTKAKVNLTQTTDKTKDLFQVEKKEEEKIELITSIDGKKVNTLVKPDDSDKKPLVIPCQKNRSVLDIKKSELIEKAKAEQEEKTKESTNNPDVVDDAAALNALRLDLKKKNEKEKDADLKIPMDANKEKEEEENVEDPNYEQIDLEKFGLAALRGMGWSEKSGIGLGNKRAPTVYEPELRPKGLGLGAGFNSKKPKHGDDSAESSLKYVKGAYVQILDGKNKNDYGQVAGFDDGMNRILIKLTDDDKIISIIQNYTRLVTKSEYSKQTGVRV